MRALFFFMSFSQLSTSLKMKVSAFRGLVRYLFETEGIFCSVSLETEGGTLWDPAVDLGEAN